MEKVTEFARRRNPNIQIFPICAKTGEGVDALAAYLKERITQWKNRRLWKSEKWKLNRNFSVNPLIEEIISVGASSFFPAYEHKSSNLYTHK